MKDDGTQEEKLISEPIAYAFGISPDERFAVVSRTLEREENWGEAEAVPVAGGPGVPLCSRWCDVNWSRDGKVMYFYWHSFPLHFQQRNLSSEPLSHPFEVNTVFRYLRFPRT
jgi:hypothetical protein